MLLESVIEQAGGTTALAAELGMTEGAVRYWIKVGRVPSGAAARLIAARYDVDVANLMGSKRG